MNSVGIDVSKGKSMIAVMRPFGEVVISPFEIRHTDNDLCELAKLLRSLPGENRAGKLRDCRRLADARRPDKHNHVRRLHRKLRIYGNRLSNPVDDGPLHEIEIVQRLHRKLGAKPVRDSVYVRQREFILHEQILDFLHRRMLP